MKKRNVLHFLCVLALVLGLFSGFGAKAHAASAPKVYIGDPWDTANCQVLANGETIDLGSSGKIAYKDGVLTMSNGYTAWGYYNYEPGKYAGIYAEGDLEICVDESYSQIHPFESAYPADAQEFYGIYVTGDLTIVNGSGWNAELSVVTSRASYKTVGIYCGGTLTVKAAGGKTMTLSANGSVPTGNDVSIGSADIDRRGFYNSGISANSAVFLPDTVVKANGAATRAGVPETIGIGNDCSGVCSWGIDATRGIEIYEGSEVTAKGCPIRTCWYEGNGYFVRSLGVRTYVSGDLTVAGSLTAVGGDVSWKDTASPANGWTAESCGASVNGRIWCNCDGFSLAGKGGALTLPSGMAKTVSCGIESPLTDSLSAGTGASSYDGTITASGETAPLALLADSSAIEGPLLTLSASADGSDATEIINGSLTQADSSANGYQYVKAESRVLRIAMDDWTYGEAGSDPVCAFLREPRQYAYSANGGITPATAFRANDYETDRPTAVGLYRIFVKCPGLGLDEPVYASFSILPRDLAASTVAFAFGEQGTYNGSSQAVQNVSVTADGVLLTNGTDYTVTAGRLAKDVAETPLTIMGLGNYAGSVTSENGWSLQRKVPVASDFNMATAGSLTQTYTGSPLSLAVPELKSGKTGIGEGAVRYRVDGVYGETAPVNAGTYDAQAVFEEGQNFAAGTVYLGALTVEKADNPMTVSPGAVTYVNGSLDLSENVSGAQGAVTFAITEALDDCSVTADGAFTAGPVMGDCVVAVRAAGADNYKPAEKTITVTVSGKELAPLTVSQKGCSFGETLADPVYEDYGVVGETAVTYEGTSYAGEAYSRTTEKPSLPGEYTVYVAYETASKLYIGSADFLIGYADIGSADIDLGTQHAYTGAEQEVVISSVTLNGVELAPGTDYEYYMGYSAVDVGPVTLTLRGKGNYSGTVFTTWSLNKGTYGGETHADVNV
ncbi:MAG: hypothetical protein K5981_04465, partial [Clostridia bacterium]|nr:hypothetical protein [Clostridia bacterium]